MRYIFHAVRMNLRAAAQYRASFLMQSVAQLVMTGCDLIALLVLIDRFRHMGRWEGTEVMFFFGAMQIAFALTECFGRGLTTFSGVIRKGSFDTLLLRPRPLLLQLSLNACDPRRVGTVAVGAAAGRGVLVGLGVCVGCGVAVAVGFGVFFGLAVGVALFFFFLDLATSTVSVWAEEACAGEISWVRPTASAMPRATIRASSQAKRRFFIATYSFCYL